MNKKDKIIYIERYNKRLKKFGYNPLTLGWKKIGRQEFRFFHLFQIYPLNKIESVLDIGCGFGDLYKFLRKNKWKGKYVGIDINENLINLGKKLYPKADLMVNDILKQHIKRKFDVVVSSGIFNAKLKYEKNDIYIKKMLKKMFELSRIGVIADFMSSYVEFKHKNAYHISPEKIFNIAKSLSRRIVLKHDYMPYEFCIYIYKKDKISAQNIFSKIK